MRSKCKRFHVTYLYDTEIIYEYEEVKIEVEVNAVEIR